MKYLRVYNSSNSTVSLVRDSSAIWGDSAVWGDSALWGDSAVWGDSALWGSSTPASAQSLMIAGEVNSTRTAR